MGRRARRAAGHIRGCCAGGAASGTPRAAWPRTALLQACRRACGGPWTSPRRGVPKARRLAHRSRLGALGVGAWIWAHALQRRASFCKSAPLCRARRPTHLALPGPGMQATHARSAAQAEEQARAAHNRPARQSRLARTLEASDAAVARQLAAEEEARLLRLLTGAPERPAGGWGAPYAPPAPAPSLQARPRAGAPAFPGARACRAGRSCGRQPATAPCGFMPRLLRRSVTLGEAARRRSRPWTASRRRLRRHRRRRRRLRPPTSRHPTAITPRSRLRPSAPVRLRAAGVRGRTPARPGLTAAVHPVTGPATTRSMMSPRCPASDGCGDWADDRGGGPAGARTGQGDWGGSATGPELGAEGAGGSWGASAPAASLHANGHTTPQGNGGGSRLNANAAPFGALCSDAGSHSPHSEAGTAGGGPRLNPKAAPFAATRPYNPLTLNQNPSGSP